MFVLLGMAIAHRYLLRYNKDNQNQRLNQDRYYPQRRMPLPPAIYFYTPGTGVRAGYSGRVGTLAEACVKRRALVV